MGTSKMTKEQLKAIRMETIINTIHFTERHYPQKVVIKREEDVLKVYSPTGGASFNNCGIISALEAMNVSCYLNYDESLKKVVLVIFP